MERRLFQEGMPVKTAYINGNVYTGGDRLQKAFLVEDGKFRMVGTNDEIRSALSDADECVDLHVACVAP